jgi:Type II secretion system (T2SS), protein M
MKIREQYNSIKTKTLLWFSKLSKREKLLIVTPSIVLVLMAFYSLVFTPIQSAFAKQSEELENSQKNVGILSVMLDRYTRLKVRREEIELQYKGIENRENGITLLEGLLRNKLDLAPGAVKIGEGSPQRFGGDFEKTPYTVRFSVSDLSKLVAFLDEVVHGKNPMILKKLDLKKRGDRSIEVDMEVSSIRKL